MLADFFRKNKDLHPNYFLILKIFTIFKNEQDGIKEISTQLREKFIYLLQNSKARDNEGEIVENEHEEWELDLLDENERKERN